MKARHVFIITSTTRVQTPRSGIQSFFLCLVGSTSANNVMPTQFQTAEAFGDNLTCIGIPVWHTFYVLSIRMIKSPHRGYLFLFPFKQLHRVVWKMGAWDIQAPPLWRLSQPLDSVTLPWLTIPATQSCAPMQSSRHLLHWVDGGDREGRGVERHQWID